MGAPAVPIGPLARRLHALLAVRPREVAAPRPAVLVEACRAAGLDERSSMVMGEAVARLWGDAVAQQRATEVPLAARPAPPLTAACPVGHSGGGGTG
jgi:hypothetical protein